MAFVLVYTQRSTAYVDLKEAKAPHRNRRGDGSELAFILNQGDITTSRKERKAVWMRHKDDPKHIFFACPWCLRVNKVEKHYAGAEYVSIWCSGKCKRHLFIDFNREKAK